MKYLSPLLALLASIQEAGILDLMELNSNKILNTSDTDPKNTSEVRF